jgi:hypothetical protein
MTQRTMTKKYEYLRERVQDVEEKMKAIINGKSTNYSLWYQSHNQCKKIVRLLWYRKELIDRMFTATHEEVVRMEQVNALLLELTNKLHAHTENLYRKTMSNVYDPSFDNDIDVEGSIKFVMDGPNSILPMDNDDYYGSDFTTMLDIISSLYARGFLHCEEMEYSYCLCLPNEYREEMNRDEMRVADNLNDGISWYRDNQPAADKLKHLCICHAIYDLSINKPYSIPDILRMNDFWVELNVKHQHFATQVTKECN